MNIINKKKNIIYFFAGTQFTKKRLFGTQFTNPGLSVSTSKAVALASTR